MKFSIEVYEKFIELVRENPCLYDSSLTQYKDAQLNQNVWRTIAYEMDDATMSWEDWKKIWKNKRDTFTRKRREIESLPSGSPEAQEIKRTPLYYQMSFLIPQIKGKRTKNYTIPLSLECKSDGELSNASIINYDSIKEDMDLITEAATTMDEPGSGSPRSLCSETSSVVREPLPEKRKRLDVGGRTLNDGKVFKRLKGNGQLDAVINQLNENSKKNMDTIHRLVRELKGDVFTFLSSKMPSFSKSTQDWMEDELLKLYLEAKRRDREICSVEQAEVEAQPRDPINPT